MKNTRNTKIKSYEFGISEIGQLAGMGGGVFQQLTGNSDTGNIIGGIGTGVASGAALGPVGAVAGGVLGAIGGIFGNNKRKEQEKLRREAIKRQNDLVKFNNLRGESSQLQSDYYSDFGPNIPTFVNGGIIGNELAYVDHNESVRTPDGNMYQVQGFNPRATDDVLTSLPNGTGILSDKLTVPGTKVTFAEAGHKLQKDMNRGNNNTGSIADTTNQLNKWAANQKYNDFLALQDDIRTSKGISNNTRSYALGTPIQEVINPVSPYMTAQMSAPTTIDSNRSVSYPSNIQFGGPQYLNAAQPRDITNLIPNYTGINTSTQPINPNNTRSNSTGGVLGGLQNAMYGLASVAPIFYNLSRGNETPEYVAPNNNPYSSTISNIMSRRRADVQPLLNANRRATRIANYNANNITGTGQNMALRLANAANERTANSEVLMRGQQLNNDYRAQEAETLNNLGQQYVTQSNYSDDLNRRNAERTRDFTATAMSQLNQWGQTQQLSRNRKISDNQKYEIWKQLAKYGLSQADLENIDKILR